MLLEGRDAEDAAEMMAALYGTGGGQWARQALRADMERRGLTYEEPEGWGDGG